MRVVILIIVVLVIAVVGSSYRFGMDTERIYNELVEQYSETENISVISRSYERGILSSNARITYAVKNLGKEVVRFDKTDTIYHGPVPVLALFKGKAGFAPVMSVIDSEVRLVPVEDSEYSKILEKMPPLDLHTVISFSNQARTDMSMASFDTEIEEGGKLSWKGFTGRVDYDINSRHSISDFNSPGFEIDGKESTLVLSGFKGWSDLSYPEASAEYPTGDINFSLDTVTFEAKEGAAQKDLAIAGMEFKGNSAEKGGTLDSAHSLVFGELTFGSYKYGPGGYEISISNIDSKSWKELQKLINENQDAAKTEESRARFAGELVQILPGFVKKSPNIELKRLSLETAEGSLEGHLGIYADGSGLENTDLAANPLLMVAVLTADAGITVSKPLLLSVLTDYKKEEIVNNLKEMGEDAPTEEELSELASGAVEDEINALVSQDILVSGDDSYTIEAAYKAGQVIINGQPIDLGALFR